MTIRKLPGILPWKMNARTVTLSTGSCSVQFRIGSKTAIVNGTSRELKSAPLLLSGKALVPLQFVAGAFGNSVSDTEKGDNIELVVSSPN